VSHTHLFAEANVARRREHAEDGALGREVVVHDDATLRWFPRVVLGMGVVRTTIWRDYGTRDSHASARFSQANIFGTFNIFSFC
jgi:hypothetical protein